MELNTAADIRDIRGWKLSSRSDTVSKKELELSTAAADIRDIRGLRSDTISKKEKLELCTEADISDIRGWKLSSRSDTISHTGLYND